MNSTIKLIRKFFSILIFSIFLGILLNLLFLAIVTWNRQDNNSSGWKQAEEIAAALTLSENGDYILSEEGEKALEQTGAWGILVENDTGNVIWASRNLPQEIPRHYTLGEISWAVRGYIQDYPTTTAAQGENLLFLGFPKDRYFKLMWPTFDYDLIRNFFYLILEFLIFNLVFIIIVYGVATSGIIRSVKPIVHGIEALGNQEDVYIPEKGLMSQLAASINCVSEKLKTQSYALRKKETARANWIAGVSHDIRTPLSMVLGHASTLEEDISLPAEVRQKAGIIRQQSIRMKNLINDLNLASKLEYNVQPVKRQRTDLVALARSVAVDFLNLDNEGDYPIEWNTEADSDPFMVYGDPDLIKRAMSNLITNAQVHNPKGCTIGVEVREEEGMYALIVSDNGVGVTEEELQSIRNAPHYMVCDSNTGEQRHGLGLLIVKQIAQAHEGRVVLDHSPQGGFLAKILLPKDWETI